MSLRMWSTTCTLSIPRSRERDQTHRTSKVFPSVVPIDAQQLARRQNMKAKGKSKPKQKTIGLTKSKKAATGSLVKPTRNIPLATTLRLYVQAGGRCEFD